MPDFSRQNRFSFFSRIPLVASCIASGVWIGLFLLVLPPTTSGAVRKPDRIADIPVVSLPRTSGELHSLASGLNGATAPLRTPYRDALQGAQAAAGENQYGQIRLASGNVPYPSQNPQNTGLTRIQTETVEPSDSPTLWFRDQPSQISSQPLSSVPAQAAMQQTTRPIRPNTDQRPRQLRPLNPNLIEPVRYGRRDFTEPVFSEDDLEDLQFPSSAETDPEENFGENNRRPTKELVSEAMDFDELWEEPGTASSTTNSGANSSNHLRSDLSDFSDNSGDLDLLSRALPEQKEKSGEKLTFSPVGAQLMPVLSVMGSLCLVLGAFFLFVLFLKKVGPKHSGNLPGEALENIGRYPLNQKLQLNLIRLGSRLILVAVTPDGGVETITEIENPDEVAEILTQCRKLDPNGSQAQFKAVLDEFAQEKSPGGFFGPADPKRKTNTAPSLSSLLAGGLQSIGNASIGNASTGNANHRQSGGVYG